MIPCHLCGKEATKVYVVKDQYVRECRYFKMPEKYIYCGAACSLKHHQTGYK